MVNLLTESASIFQESFRSDMNFIEKSQLGVKFTKTNTVIKNHIWEKRFKFKKYEESSTFDCSPKIGWFSNGIWNVSVIPFLKGKKNYFNLGPAFHSLQHEKFTFKSFSQCTKNIFKHFFVFCNFRNV